MRIKEIKKALRGIFPSIGIGEKNGRILIAVFVNGGLHSFWFRNVIDARNRLWKIYKQEKRKNPYSVYKEPDLDKMRWYFKKVLGKGRIVVS